MDDRLRNDNPENQYATDSEITNRSSSVTIQSRLEKISKSCSTEGTRLVSQFLSLSAAKYPDKIALIVDGKKYSYGNLYKKVRNAAGYLVDNGLKHGDRVGVLLQNSVEAVVSIFGILEAGGCFVVINPTTKKEKLAHILANSDAVFVISDVNLKTVITGSLNLLLNPPVNIVVGSKEFEEVKYESITQRECDFEWEDPLDIDLACIIYTSGSTGEPKGVTMTHRNVISAANSITTYLENAEDDIILSMLPLSFDYGLYQLLMAFKIGGTLVLEKGFGYPYQILELIKKEKVTGLPCVPTMFALLLQLENLESENLTTVRYLSNTAAPLPPSFISRLHTAFPNARIYSMYGLTECKRVSYLPPDQINDKPNSVGIAMPNAEVWIVDENGDRLPPGEVGELVVRGGSVMKCYWKDPEGTAEVLKEGKYPWEKVLYTGDLFRMDKDNCLYFVGRKDDIIKSRGERISPKEIENVLYSLNEVLHARVTGIPHEIYGNAIKAEIVIKEGYTLNEKQVKIYCRRHLEDLMVPQIIEFVPDLPVSSSGKIKRSV